MTTPKNPAPNLIHPKDPYPSGEVRNKLPVVRDGLAVIDPHNTTFDELHDRFSAKRVQYAPMRARMELSAQVLAVGGTFKMAAARAGCSVRQVKKYYSSADYRARIDELRSTLLSRLRGRIVRELERRTSDEKIQRMELLDLLRVYDRVLGPGKGAGGTHIGEVNVTTNNYDTLLAALVAPDSGTEGVDFPILESTDFPLSGGSSPIEG